MSKGMDSKKNSKKKPLKNTAETVQTRSANLVR